MNTYARVRSIYNNWKRGKRLLNLYNSCIKEHTQSSNDNVRQRVINRTRLIATVSRVRNKDRRSQFRASDFLGQS